MENKMKNFKLMHYIFTFFIDLSLTFYVNSVFSFVVADTQVLLYNDEEIPVTQIKHKDKVIIPYSDHYSAKIKEVQQIAYEGILYEIVVDGLFSVIASPDHLFLNKLYRPIQMHELTIGSYISTQNGFMQVTKKEALEFSGLLYRLILEKESLNILDLTLLTNGIVSCDNFLLNN